jgi:uncharacterized coiled-coil protein SlyX
MAQTFADSPSIRTASGIASLNDLVKTAAAAPQPQVPAAMNDLRNNIERLDQSISILAERLKSVVTCVPEDSKAHPVPVGLVELANALDQNSAHINYLNDKVNGLLSGLQL